MDTLKKYQPLDDLEMFELLQAAYPEKFPDDDNETWDAAMDFIEELEGFEALADFMGRVATLCMPMVSPITGTARHCLGKVTIVGDEVHMEAAVSRLVQP